MLNAQKEQERDGVTIGIRQGASHLCATRLAVYFGHAGCGRGKQLPVVADLHGLHGLWTSIRDVEADYQCRCERPSHS